VTWYLKMNETSPGYCDSKALFLNADEPASGLHSQGFTLQNNTATGLGVRLVSSACPGQCLAGLGAGSVSIAACSAPASGGWSAVSTVSAGAAAFGSSTLPHKKR